MSGGCLHSIPELPGSAGGDHRGGKGARTGQTVSLTSQRKTQPALRQQPSLKVTQSARKKKNKKITDSLYLAFVSLSNGPEAQLVESTVGLC